MKKIALITMALLVIVSCQQKLEGDFEELYYVEGERIYNEGNFEELLRLSKQLEKQFPEERVTILEGRSRIYTNLGQHEKATEALIQVYEIDSLRKPYKSLDVGESYIKLGKLDEAINWIKISIDSGFNDYNYLRENSLYIPLKDDILFQNIISNAEKNAGIGGVFSYPELTDLNGSPISLESYKGKVVMLDFWASWCPPCITGIPKLKKHYEKYKEQGFDIIGINLDDESGRNKFIEIVKKNEIPWVNHYSGNGFNDDQIRKSFNVKYLPSYWLVDKGGIIRHYNLKEDEVENKILTLLNE